MPGRGTYPLPSAAARYLKPAPLAFLLPQRNGEVNRWTLEATGFSRIKLLSGPKTFPSTALATTATEGGGVGAGFVLAVRRVPEVHLETSVALL